MQTQIVQKIYIERKRVREMSKVEVEDEDVSTKMVEMERRRTRDGMLSRSFRE